jgi:hypothetical protein
MFSASIIAKHPNLNVSNCSSQPHHPNPITFATNATPNQFEQQKLSTLPHRDHEIAQFRLKFADCFPFFLIIAG